MFKHDKAGFLIGELISGQKDTQEFQQASMSLWRGLRTDVRAIARILGASSTNARPAAPGRKAAGAAAASPRAGRVAPAQDPVTGRFIAAPKPVIPKRTARAEKQADKSSANAAVAAATAATTAVVSERDGRGRFKGNGKGDGDGGVDPDRQGLGARIADRLSGISTAIQGMSAGTEQMDPAVAAAKEVKDVVAPLGRGMFALFGRSAEKKKERWYTRILQAIQGKSKRPEDAPAISVASDGGGGMLGMLARVVPAIIGLLGVGLAGLLGTKIGGAIYSWLDKSGIMTKVFDAIDSMREFVGTAIDWLKKSKQEFSDSFDLARAGVGGTAPVMDGSGRNINDPRRLDVAQQPDTVATKAGRIMGSVARGADYMAGETTRTAAQNKALITGRQYRAGNIAGLDDAQTRALVASTVATESDGGNLGVVNKAGYMGRYQAGAGWLADAGMLKGGSEGVKAAMKADGFTREYDWGKSGGMSRYLQKDENWKDGMSYSKYLRSADAQDGAFKTNSDKAYGDMMRKGVITPNTPPAEVAGLLKARHIAGLGGAEAVATGGTGPADANGTTARKYFEDVTKDRGGFRAAYASEAPAARAVAAGIPGAVGAPGVAGVPGVAGIHGAAPVVATSGAQERDAVRTAYAGVSPVASGAQVASIATPRAPRVATASVPSVVPDKLPQPQEVVAPPPAAPEKDKVVRAVMREPIGQDVGDRNIAHIVSGGIGGT